MCVCAFDKEPAVLTRSRDPICVFVCMTGIDYWYAYLIMCGRYWSLLYLTYQGCINKFMLLLNSIHMFMHMYISRQIKPNV